MATTSEYGEELLMEGTEGETAKASQGPLPSPEDLGEREVAEHEEAEEETHHRAGENHEAHRPGAVCAHCGAVLTEADDARLMVDGRWAHESCPGA